MKGNSERDSDHKNEEKADSGHQGSEKVQTPQYDVPVDRGWAWVVLLSTFTIAIFVIGGIKSFGVLLVEFSRVYKSPQSQLTTIQSITGFFFLSLSPFSNWLCERFTHQKVIFIGGLLTSSGLILSFLAPSIEVMYFTYGVLTGFGFGLSFPPSVVIATRHFNKRRGLANGINMAGAAVGGICMPILMQMLIDNFGLKGCMLILGGTMANICPCALLLRPTHRYPRLVQEKVEEMEKLDSDGGTKKDWMNLVTRKNVIEITIADGNDESSEQKPHIENGGGKVDHDATTCLLDKPESKTQSQFVSRRQHKTSESNSIAASLTALSTISLSHQNIPQEISIAEDTSTANSTDLMCCEFFRNLNFSLFKNVSFSLLLISFFFTAYSYHSIFIILPSYGIEQGLTRHQSMSFIPAFGIVDVIGRLIAGIINDKCIIWRKYIFIFYILLHGLGYILVPLFHSFWDIMMWCTAFGIFTGGFNGTFVIMIVDCVGIDLLSSGWGFTCLIVSIAMLINPVLSGGLKDISGTWSTSIFVSASFALFSFALLITEAIFARVQKKRRNKEESF
ncbi:monocarboxylate transporter 12-like isoform X2 [Saccostrea echinata]|uniref:monocarboxylate transporter 12-like isoform X2 n=1 Tax=Saccostrea echinata TaxID=191078 RepID=UPI002A805D47|nr:monocarboxylate transporter 12-like isoform X2 [Saccostrea echinata]